MEPITKYTDLVSEPSEQDPFFTCYQRLLTEISMNYHGKYFERVLKDILDAYQAQEVDRLQIAINELEEFLDLEILASK